MPAKLSSSAARKVQPRRTRSRTPLIKCSNIWAPCLWSQMAAPSAIKARSDPGMEVIGKHRQADTLSSLQSLLVTVVIAVFVITFVVQAFQIPSESMENTLLIGDYLLVDKLRYGGSESWNHLMPYRPIRRGDIIVFRYPLNPTQHFVKRVIGLPGDRVRLIHRRVWVNHVPLREDYVVYNLP